jgi:hypothetical protein
MQTNNHCTKPNDDLKKSKINNQRHAEYHQHQTSTKPPKAKQRQQKKIKFHDYQINPT